MIATGNYWGQDKAFSPLMHTWYVGLVMQFYLVFPLLFYAARFDKREPQRTFLCLISVMAVLSLMIFIGEKDDAHRFYLLPSRFFEFAVGCVAAQLYNPTQNKPFSDFFVYVSYFLLVLLFTINNDFIQPELRLLFVVALSCVLLCSQASLENKITGNVLFAKIGMASYSIFVWHQVVLAFYRCLFGSSFTPYSYIVILIVVGFVSSLSYYFIEKAVSNYIKTRKGTVRVWGAVISLFVILNLFAFSIYLKAGVVRDIPELEVQKSDPHRGMWAKYNDRIFDKDKSFETNKVHWLIIGNSFGRDFANMVCESEYADKIEISYCDEPFYRDKKYEERFKTADKIFVASKYYTEEFVHDIELMALAFGHTLNDVIVVGEKYFGETMTQIYSRRFMDDYFQTRIRMNSSFVEKNNHFRNVYKNRFIDLISMTDIDNGNVKVFTEDGFFISSDCTHLTRAGAEYYANRIEWANYLE